MTKKILIQLNPANTFVIMVEGKWWTWIFTKLFHIELWDNRDAYRGRDWSSTDDMWPEKKNVASNT